MIQQDDYKLEKLKSVFSAAPCGVGVFLADSEQPLYFNDAYYKLVGYTPEEYGEQIGGDYHKLFFTGDRSVYNRIAESVSSTGSISAEEYRIIRKSGDIRWVRLSIHPITVDGKDCALCFFEDITAEKDSFEQLRLVSESVGNSISVILMKGNKRELIYANDTFFRWVGADRDSYDNATLEYNMSFVADEDRAWTAAAVRKSIQTGEPQELEYRFIRPGEPIRWMNRRLKAIKRDETDAYLIVSIVSDITEKKELEQKLVFERERYQDAVDNMPSGFVKIRLEKDGSARPVFINKAFAVMTKMTGEECMALYGEDSYAGVHPDDLDRITRILKDFRPGDIKSFILRLRCGKSGWMWVRICSTSREEDGALMLYNSYFDVTAEQENRFMLDRIINELPGGVAIFKVSDTLECQYFNDGFAALSDRTREELDEAFRDDGFITNIIYQSDIDTVAGEIKRHAAAGDPINTTFRFLTKNGEVKWLHMNASKLREDGGYPVYYCIFTEPSRQNMLYRSIVDETGVGIIVSDEKTHEIYYVNRAFRSLMQIKDEQYAGRCCYEYVRGLDSPCKECAALRLAEGGDNEEIQHFPSNDTYVQLRSALVNWLGRTSLVEYVTDVTADYRKQLQQQELLNCVPSGFGIFEIDRGGVSQVYMNDYYYRMIGEARESRDEKIKTHYMNEVHPDDRIAVNSMVESLNGGDDSDYVDIRVKCGNDEYRWFRLTASVVKREGEKLTVYCSYADMDEMIKTQKKLEQANGIIQKQYESEREKRKLLEKDSVIFVKFNITQDKLVEYNVQSPDYTCYTPGSDSGTIRSDMSRRIPIDAERIQVEDFFSPQSNIELFKKGVTERSVEYRSRQNDGRLHWLRASSRFGHDVFTDDILSFIYIQDIDFNKKKELAAESLVEEETDYVILLSVAEDRCRLLRFKDDLKQYGDLQVGEKIYFDFRSIPDRLESVISEDRENVTRFFDHAGLMESLKTQPVISLTFCQTTKDGHMRRKKIRAFYLDETKEDIIIAKRDITDLYEEEQEQKHALEKALDEAMSASRAKTTFLSNMSHEIRTPINAIIGMTELARDDTKNPAVKDSLASIRNSSEYLLKILNDILDMSRIESGKFTLDCQWVSPLEVINPCVAMIRPAAEAKHIEFRTPEMNRIGQYEYYVDVLKTQRMVMNLLNNACKFTGEGGWISISFKNKCHDGENSVDLITIEDNGCGMSEDFLKRVFTPFAQEHNIYSNTAQGTGLGLSLARQTAVAMGGDITVESKLGEGSKFTIIFPYKYRPKPVAQAPEPQPQIDLSVLNGTRILLCEDNHLNTVIAKRLLEKAGCVVDCAENGKIGVDSFAASAPWTYQAVLMDIRMPEMDGLSATQCIRALDRPDAKAIPIIAMSANAFEDDVQKSLDAGMNAHLPKPVEPQKMYEALAKLIGQNK